MKSEKRMKISLSFFLLCAGYMFQTQSAEIASATFCRGQDFYPRTFFRPRPFSQDSVLELGLSQYSMYSHPSESYWCPWLYVQITPFYYKSLNKKDLARYFLPNQKCCITVEQNNTSDVSSPWLQLVNDTEPFASTFCLNPSRWAVGAGFNLRISGEQFLSGCWDRLWINAFAPLVHVSHALQIDERITGGRGQVEELQTVTDALNNCDWHYGKFPTKSKTRTAIDDVEIKMGIDFMRHECGKGGVYGMVYVPTGHASRACTVFEPLLGNGDHAGVGGGLYGDWFLWQECDQDLSILVDLHGAYFLPSVEIRSFDLKNSTWSRYMLFANEGTPATSFPAINFLSFPVEVTPRGMIEAWIAVHYHYCDIHVEAGYDFWWRDHERICINCDPFAQSVSIYDIGRLQGQTSASTATISQGVAGEANAPVSDAEFTPLTIENLCICSGAAPRAMSSKIYGSVAWDIDWDLYNGILGFGISYEHAHVRSALSQVGVWVKAAIDF